jgi:DNA-binding CsgD family transcriptional regulator/catechol 2,3-dioxygenase-like lactoylglutathione lyase family enzyme
MKQQRGRPPHPDVLTRAEWRVVEAVRHGMTNGEIAARQRISPDAVKFHVSNALAKLGFRNRAQLRRWNGVRGDSALARRGKTTMTGTTKLGPLAQIARTVGNAEAARRWYEEVLGLTHLYSFPKMSFFDLGGTRLYLQEGAVQPGESILYFRVPDIHAAHAELTGRGASFLSAPHIVHTHPDGTEEWLAIFKDNEDRMLAIMAQAKPG